MSETFSSIWLELGHPRQKKILVCQLYRDLAYLGQYDAISGSTQAQLTRWLEFLSQWEAALSENKEVVVLGDCNLNFLTFNEACSDHVADKQTEIFSASTLQSYSAAWCDTVCPGSNEALARSYTLWAGPPIHYQPFKTIRCASSVSRWV